MRSSSQFRLLAARRFGPLFWTQLLGAFNDNLFKNALVLLVTYQATLVSTIRPEVLVNLCGGVLILPFFVFSASAGQLADKYERSQIVRLVKLLEVVIMLVGAAGFAMHSLGLLLGTLFLLGTHSAFFGPVKYALLPQHLREEELVGGNGLIEFGTFIAILAGTIAGGVLMSDASGVYLAPACAIAVAALGYVASRLLPHSPAPDPGLRLTWNPLRETWNTLRFAWPTRAVFNSLLGISWFWFLGALMLAQFPSYAKDYLGGAPGVVTSLLAAFSVGVGAGSLLTERLSGHKIEIGLVPFGSIGITLFALDLYFASPAPATGALIGPAAFLATAGSWRVLLDLFFLGLFGGFYAVPLYALVQSRTETSHTSRVIAANNILNALFIVIAAAFGALLLDRGLSVPQLFLVTAVLNAAVALYIYRMVPEFLMRFIVWLLIHSVYRLRTRGLEHVPETGAAVVAANHVSYVDALVIIAACRRPIRFIMDHNIFKIPVLSFVFRQARAIPIAPAKEDAALLERAYDETARTLRAGGIVGIFPEGRLTPDGEIQPFRGGVQRIVETTAVPVVHGATRSVGKPVQPQRRARILEAAARAVLGHRAGGRTAHPSGGADPGAAAAGRCGSAGREAIAERSRAARAPMHAGGGQMRSILFAVLAAFAFQVSAADAPPQKENWFKRAGKSIAKDAKVGWKQAKKGYSKSGKQIGRDTAGATKRVGGEMKQSAKRTGKAAKDEF